MSLTGNLGNQRWVEIGGFPYFCGIISTVSSSIVNARPNRPNIVAVGTIVWLASELMFFAALFAMYFTTRAVQGPEKWAEGVEMLNIPFSAINTTVLVLSSVTCQFGVFAAERFQNVRTGSIFQISKWGMREWFALTLDRKSTRLNSSHVSESRMPSSA